MRVCRRGIFLAVLASVATSIAASAQEPEADGPRARLVLPQPEYDFGRLSASGGLRTVEMTLRNVGEHALDIRKVRTSCICLTAMLSTTSIAPKGEASLRLQIDPSRVEEVFTEEVLIYSSDARDPLKKIRILGNTSMPVRIDPLALPVGISYRGDLKRIPFPPVHVTAVDGAPLAPVRATSSHPAIRPEVRRLDDGSHQVAITVDESLPLGQVKEWIELRTAHPRMPSVRIPVLGAVVGELTPVGRVADFGFVREGQPASATIKLPKRGTRDIKILGATARLLVPTEADATMTPEGTHLQVTVRIASPVAFTSLSGHVEVHTDDPAEPVVNVPVAGAVFANRPFERAAADGADATFMNLVKAALARGDAYPTERFFADILGGAKDQRAVKVLLRALSDGDLPTRMRAVELLGLANTPEVLERLRLTITEDPEEFVRRNAVVAYAEAVGAAAIPELLLALQDDYAWVREDAAVYLGRFGDARVIPALRAALSDPDPEASGAIRDALGAVQGRVK